MYTKVSGKTVMVASRTMAVMAAAILLSYIIEIIWQRPTVMAFFGIDAESIGLVYGISPAALFVAAFLLELRARSVITSGLIISGGAAMGTLSVARNTLADLGVANISTDFANVSSLGYVIMGLGILHLVKLRENKDRHN